LRRLDQAGDDRRLAQAERSRRGRRRSGCGVDAVGAAAEIDAVEVELEDLVLAELALERERQHAFLELAAEGAAVGQEDVAGELLGDGRAALAPAAGLDPDLERAGDADRIDADVLRKRLSSTAIIAARMVGGISLVGSHWPKLGPSDTSTVPSARAPGSSGQGRGAPQPAQA
jgi:hypothetical protein